jgi:hypothetical protein
MNTKTDGYDTQDEENQNKHTTQNVWGTPISYAQANTNNVNKTWAHTNKWE